MSDVQRYFFVHLQKTAGSSLYMRLCDFFGRDAVYPQPSDVEREGHALDVDYLKARFAENRDAIRVVAGHFPLCTTDVLGVPFSTFTVLRDPIERTLSYLRHHKKLQHAPAETTLEEIYAHPMRLHGVIHNHMVKMLSLTPEEMTAGALTMVPFDEARLELAKQNLEQRIDVFGLQEQFEDFCNELETRFGWDLGPPRVANQTEPHDVTDEFRERIGTDNRMDVELYRFAEQLLRQRNAWPTP